MEQRTIDALTEALEDEYKARAAYRRIIETYGERRPFINIVEAESRHIASLLSLFDKYDLTPPSDDWAEKVDVPSSYREACADGVQAEIDNAAMYDRFLETVQEADIRRVFENLQAASRENHLPAFRRCLERARD